MAFRGPLNVAFEKSGFCCPFAWYHLCLKDYSDKVNAKTYLCSRQAIQQFRQAVEGNKKFCVMNEGCQSFRLRGIPVRFKIK